MRIQKPAKSFSKNMDTHNDCAIIDLVSDLSADEDKESGPHNQRTRGNDAASTREGQSKKISLIKKQILFRGTYFQVQVLKKNNNKCVTM